MNYNKLEEYKKLVAWGLEKGLIEPAPQQTVSAATIKRRFYNDRNRQSELISPKWFVSKQTKSNEC